MSKYAFLFLLAACGEPPETINFRSQPQPIDLAAYVNADPDADCKVDEEQVETCCSLTQVPGVGVCCDSDDGTYICGLRLCANDECREPAIVHRPDRATIATASVFSTSIPKARTTVDERMMLDLADAPEDARKCVVDGDIETCCSPGWPDGSVGTCCANTQVDYYCEIVSCGPAGIDCY